MKELNSKNIGDWFLEGKEKYYTPYQKNDEIIKEVITDNGYVVGLTKEGDVLVSQMVVCGTSTINLFDEGYDDKDRIDTETDMTFDVMKYKETEKIDLEEKFNKLVDNLSKSKKEFKDGIDWSSVGYGNEEILNDNLEGIFK